MDESLRLDRPWRGLGALLVVEETVRETLGGVVVEASAVATLSATRRGTGMHARAEAPTAADAVAEALSRWASDDDDRDEVRPDSGPQQTGGCPHRDRPVCDAEAIERLGEDIQTAVPGAKVTAELWRRTLGVSHPDGRRWSCHASAWRLELRVCEDDPHPHELFLLDAAIVDVDALAFELEAWTIQSATDDLSGAEDLGPGADLPIWVAPAAVRDLVCILADQAYARGISQAVSVQLADVDVVAPGGRCFDAVGRRPTATAMASVADETAEHGAAAIFLPGIAVPSRLGAVVVPREESRPWRRPTDARILLECGGMAPPGLMSRHQSVLAPVWADLRGGRVTAVQAGDPGLVDVASLVGGIRTWSADGTYRRGLVEVWGGWWLLAGGPAAAAGLLG